MRNLFTIAWLMISYSFSLACYAMVKEDLSDLHSTYTTRSLSYGNTTAAEYETFRVTVGHLIEMMEAELLSTYPLYQGEIITYMPLEKFTGDTVVFRTRPLAALTPKQQECLKTAYNVQIFEGVFNEDNADDKPAVILNPKDKKFLAYIKKERFTKIMYEAEVCSHLSCDRLHRAALYSLKPGGIYVLPIHNPVDLEDDFKNKREYWPEYILGTNFETEAEIIGYYTDTEQHFKTLGFKKVEFIFSRRDFKETEDGIPSAEKEFRLTDEEAEPLDAVTDPNDYDDKYAKLVNTYFEQERDTRMAGIKLSQVFMVLTK